MNPIRILSVLRDSVIEFKSAVAEELPYGKCLCRACAQRVHPIRDVHAHLICPLCGHIFEK